MRPTPSTMTKSKGFTLIELVVVIVLLGILAAVAVPRFFDAGSDARKASLRALSGAIQDAKKFSKARYRINGQSGAGTVTLDGTSVAVVDGGNPSATSAGIGTAVESEGFTFGAPSGTTIAATITGFSGTPCSVTYDHSDGSVTIADGGC